MTLERFSKRYNIQPALLYDRVPKRVRLDFVGLVVQTLPVKIKDGSFYSEAFFRNAPSLRDSEDIRWRSDNVIKGMLSVVTSCQWWEFYDICEAVFEVAKKEETKHWAGSLTAKEFAQKLNLIFEGNALGYEIKDGRVERIGAAYVDKQIEKARILLKAPEFEGADIQFEKAIQFRNRRPQPDSENCVKDAVGAVEAVARIVTGDSKSQLDQIAKKLASEGIIPSPLDQVFIKLYASRGALPGVAHAQVGKSKVSEEEAEFVLGMCASMIIYLASKFGKEVV